MRAVIDDATGAVAPIQLFSNTSMSPARTPSGSPLMHDGDSDSDFGEAREDFAFSEFLGRGNNNSEAYELQDRSSKANYEREHEHEADDDQAELQRGGYAQRRLSNSTAASFQLYTPDEEQAVVRKFDRRLVLFLSVCYMMSFLDRSSMLSTVHAFVLAIYGYRTNVFFRHRQCAACRDGNGFADQASQR